jgi:hypothetical protein
MLLAMYVGIALALIVTTVGPIALREGLEGFRQPGVAVLSAPLMLMFFALTGHARADCHSRRAERELDRAPPRAGRSFGSINGVRLAMIAVGVLPAAIVGGGSAAILWGLWSALVHAMVCAAMGWLLTEILLAGLRKIPFTCIYFPGRPRVQLWPLYILAFTNYCFTTAAIEIYLIRHPRTLGVSLAFAGAAIVGIATLRARALARPPGLRFEEEDPEALFEGFRLSEGLAAQSRRLEL